MDEARLRAARQAAANRHPSDVEPEPEKPKEKEHKEMSQYSNYHKRGEESSKMKIIVAAVVAAVLVVAVFGGWMVWSNLSSTGIDSSKYQAVFFTNGQVYFGKLNAFNDGYMKLTNVFYIQAAQQDSGNPQKTSNQQDSLSLIKLGNEIHAPEDDMLIAKDQVLFYENLKSDGKVSQLIDQYLQSHK